MMSRSSIFPSLRASRQPRMASNVNGLSRMAPSVISRPASMRFANRHLSFTRQKLDRPHLPQIHPNRVVGTPGIVMTEVTACLGQLAFGCHRLFALVVLGHCDPEFG